MDQEKHYYGNLSAKYFWMYIVGLTMVVGINSTLFFALISLAGVYVLKLLYKDEEFFVNFDYFETVVVFLIAAFLVPYFFIFSVIVFALYLTKLNYIELFKVFKIHTYVGVFAIAVSSVLSFVMYKGLLSSLIGVFFGALLSIVVGVLVGFFIYFKIFLKLLKEFFYHEFSFYVLWLSYSIIMSLIIVWREVM